MFSFRDGFFPSQFTEIKEAFKRIKRENEYDLVFTHYREDQHQDHKLISELTWNTLRNHQILKYEVIKWDGDIGNPNVYIEIPKELAVMKNRILQDCFISQKSKHWFTQESFTSSLRMRGIESANHYAEAFYGRKILVS